MKRLGNMALIGSGASAIYLLNQIATHTGKLSGFLDSITILEKTSLAGCGMPYHPETTDVHNLSNISSEELPELPETFYDWLLARDPDQLRDWLIDPAEIDKSEVYGRLPLGAYLHAQYRTLLSRITAASIAVSEETRCNVTDIFPDDSGGKFHIETSDRERMTFDSVVIATGHCWSGEDDAENGYYSSPWPISKILPAEGEYRNVRIGTLGASLSAFDVISSLSHRHGDFRKNGEHLTYHPFPGTENFHLTMHSADGWLPHLQFSQDEPFRVIYRHVGREELLALRDDDGWLRISDYFEKVCRPALLEAFTKDGFNDVAGKLESPGFGFADFVKLMSDKHEYSDAFAGMAEEMIAARDSVENHKPIHWKEVMDDLMYTLNFHAELMPAEDHLFFKKEVMPFLMSVIAAMPLPSGEMLLALHAAGKLDLVPGRVSLGDDARKDGSTTVTVDDSGEKKRITYGMFIDCSGQKPMELEEYAFQGLVKSGHVRSARAEFASEENYLELERKGEDAHIFKTASKHLLHTGGIEIDASYRLVGKNGSPDSGIFDIAFPHTSGVRPYSYGLQACNAAAEIVVGAWLEAIDKGADIEGDLEQTTERYVKI